MWVYAAPTLQAPKPSQRKAAARAIGLSSIYLLAMGIVLWTTITLLRVTVITASADGSGVVVSMSPPNSLLEIAGLAFLLCGLATLASTVTIVATALLTRARLVRVNIGPLIVMRVRHGLRLSFAWVPMGTSNVYFTPTGTRSLWIRRLLIHVAGPAAYLIIGCVAWYLSVALAPVYAHPVNSHVQAVYGPPLRPGAPLLALLCAFLTTWCFARAAAIFVPLGGGGDGAAIWFFLTRPREAVAATTTLVVAGLAAQGARPRDWPQQLLDRAASSFQPGTAHAFDTATLLYWSRLDRGDIQGAEQALRSLTPTPPARQALLQACVAEFAYFSARWRQDRAFALASWQAIALYGPPDALPVWLRARADAALALLDGQAATAHALALAGLGALEQAQPDLPYPAQPVADNLRDLLALASQRMA